MGFTRVNGCTNNLPRFSPPPTVALSGCGTSAYRSSSVSVFFWALNLHLTHIYHHDFPLPPRLVELSLAGQSKLTALASARFPPYAQYALLLFRAIPNSRRCETGCDTHANIPMSQATGLPHSAWLVHPAFKRRSRCGRNNSTISLKV